MDTLSSVPTSRSQPGPPLEVSRPAGVRRPSASHGEGLRGFQFPLTKTSAPPPNANILPTRPALQRNFTAAPLQPTHAQPVPLATLPTHSPSPTRPTMLRMHSAAPVMAANSPTKSNAPQISITIPPRPPMMRQASVAVMEGRAPAPIQVQAVPSSAQGQGVMSPSKSLGVPPAIGLGVMAPVVGMSRTRSGSRGDEGMGLRDMMRVSRPCAGPARRGVPY